jgi:cell division protein FtsI/penicillin-binding protein 2
VTGFFPYKKPKYAFVFLAEDGPAKKLYVVS